jgi:O-antigen/teichoic acid export membrane protein
LTTGTERESHDSLGAHAARPPDSVVRGTLLLSGAQAAQAVAHGVIHIVAANQLSVEAYGRFAVMFLFAIWFGIGANSIIMPGLRKIVSEDATRFRAALTFSARWYAPLLVVLAVALACLAPMLAALFGDPKLAPLFLLVAALMPFSAAMRGGIDLFAALRNFTFSTIIRVAYAFFATVITCRLLLLGAGDFGAVAGLLTGIGIAGTLALALLVRERRRHPRASYPPMKRRAAYWTAISLPSAAAMGLLMSVDILMVKALATDGHAAGLYAGAYSLSRFPFFLVYGLGTALFPRISQAVGQQNVREAGRVIAQALRSLMIVFVPIFFITAASSSEIITFLFTKKYEPVAVHFTLLVGTILFAAIMDIALRVLNAANRPSLSLVMILGVLTLAVAVQLLMIPKFALMGAACGAAVTFFLGAVIGLGLMFLFFRIWPSPLTALRCVAAGSAVCLAGWFWPAPGAWVLAKMAALCMAYAGLLIALGELKRDDLRTITAALFKPGRTKTL